MARSLRPRQTARRWTLALCALAGMVCVAACGPQAPGRSASAPAADPFPLGRCDVTITGAEQYTFTTPGGVRAFGSVYWMSDQELRDYFEWNARDANTADEDIPFGVDQAMARNPRFAPLLVTCWDPKVVLTLVPGRGSRYELIPFRPAAYRIAPAARVEKAIPGHFAAQTMVTDGKQVLEYVPVGTGTLDVTTFDTMQIVGRFSYRAEAGARKIAVSGHFAFRRSMPGAASR